MHRRPRSVLLKKLDAHDQYLAMARLLCWVTLAVALAAVAVADNPAVAATTIATTSTDAAMARGDTGEPIDVVFTVGILLLDC